MKNPQHRSLAARPSVRCRSQLCRRAVPLSRPRPCRRRRHKARARTSVIKQPTTHDKETGRSCRRDRRGAEMS